MRSHLLKVKPRPFGGAAKMVLTGFGLAVAFVASANAATQPTLHGEAMAALADTRTAIDELVRSSDMAVSDPTPYKQAAQRAINALVGHDSSAYKKVEGDRGDAAGALGHLNWLLHRPGTQPWNAAVHGAWVNDTVAVDKLKKALSEHGLDEYQMDVTDALEALEVAEGRNSTNGALGGLEGALATTELAVPDGAHTVSGCATPTQAPAYGVTKGHLLYVAMPSSNGAVQLPQPLAVRRISMKQDVVIAHTVAADKVKQLCGNKQIAMNGSDPSAHSDPPADPLPKLYTENQAEAGKQLYMKQCSSCHGDHMQGTSAPANAGSAFLSKAKSLDWSVSDMRYLVVNSMPLNNPGSLSSKQYAQVLAFLLASDCYPSGDTPFPTKDTAKLKHAKLAPPKGVKADNPKLGLCHVK